LLYANHIVAYWAAYLSIGYESFLTLVRYRLVDFGSCSGRCLDMQKNGAHCVNTIAPNFDSGKLYALHNYLKRFVFLTAVFRFSPCGREAVNVGGCRSSVFPPTNLMIAFRSQSLLFLLSINPSTTAPGRGRGGAFRRPLESRHVASQYGWEVHRSARKG
jgi:hypothetical protein